MEDKKKCRYWFEKYYVMKPVKDEEKIFNKYKHYIKYALKRITYKDSQADDMISKGQLALLKKIRYDSYIRSKLKEKGVKIKNFYAPLLIRELRRELSKELCQKAKMVYFIDDYDYGSDSQIDATKKYNERCIPLTSEDAIFSMSWRNYSNGKTINKEVRPAIHGNPEGNSEHNIKLKRVLKIMNEIPLDRRDTILNHFLNDKK